MNKISFVAVGVSMALASTSALALGEPTDTVTIDFTGSDGLTGNEEVGSLDWAVGSSLTIGSMTAGEDFITSGGDCGASGPTLNGTNCSFEVYSQAALQGYADAGGNPSSPLGINNLWEWTYVFGGTELVTDASFSSTLIGTDGSGNDIYEIGGTQTFSLASEDIFFELYYDDLGDASGQKSDILSGTGFDDGQLIMSSSQLGDISGNFTSTQYTFVDLDGNGLFTTGDQILDPALLDSFGVDNWADEPAAGDITFTVTGEGATDLEAEVAFQDFAFFKDLLASIFFDTTFSTENVIPFNETNPSFCYDNTAGASSADLVCLQEGEITFADLDTIVLTDGTVLTAQDFLNGGDPATNQAFNDCLVAGGTVEECFLPLTGEDVIFQTDANQAFRITRVPEPGTIALLGMGMGLMGLNGVRRRRTTTLKA